MQFTVQASAMMSMRYIYASAIRFKDSFSAESSNWKNLGSEPFGNDKTARLVSVKGLTQSYILEKHWMKHLQCICGMLFAGQ